MTLIFATISDVDRSRQRIMDCKLKTANATEREFCIDRPSIS